MAFTNLVNYIKKVWKDAPSTDTPINAVNLNHMEDGIFNNATAVNQLGSNLTASDDLRFQFSKSGNKYGYLDANGNFVSFKTAHTGTYNATSRSAALDMGEDHSYRYVNTNNIQTSGTYTATSNGTKDMGATNNYRYVNVNVPNTLMNTFSNEAGVLYDPEAGQTHTDVFTASTAGEYLVWAWGMDQGDDPGITPISISSTGTFMGGTSGTTTSGYRLLTWYSYVYRLAANQTITTSVGRGNYARGRQIIRVK